MRSHVLRIIAVRRSAGRSDCVCTFCQLGTLVDNIPRHQASRVFQETHHPLDSRLTLQASMARYRVHGSISILPLAGGINQRHRGSPPVWIALDLGCNAVWLNPCMIPPFKDAGYDVRDYRLVSPHYSTTPIVNTLPTSRGARTARHIISDPGLVCESTWFRRGAEALCNEYSDRDTSGRIGGSQAATV